MAEVLRRKIVVMGDPSVGKSTLLGKYLGAEFSSEYHPTLDGEVMFHQATVFDQPVSLQFWDTAGGEADAQMLKIDCKQAHACILTYDVGNAKSFASLQRYRDLFLNVTDVPNAPIFVVGCKYDNRGTTFPQNEAWCQLHNAQHWLVSAKNDQVGKLDAQTYVGSVKQLVTCLLERIVPKPENGSTTEAKQKVYCDDLSCALEWPCEVHGEESTLLSKHHEPVVNGDVLGLEYLDHVEVSLAGKVFRIRQDRRIAETGGMVWDASIILAEYFAEHPELVRGKTCFELGAGLGLCGIVVGSLGAREVVITDVDDYIPIIQENITTNLPGTSCVVAAEYRWGTQNPLTESKVPVDVVFGSDIIYNPEFLDDLLASFSLLGASEIYLAHKTRFKPIEDHFFTKCSQQFLVQRVHAATSKTYELREQVRIVRLRPRPHQAK